MKPKASRQLFVSTHRLRDFDEHGLNALIGEHRLQEGHGMCRKVADARVEEVRNLRFQISVRHRQFATRRALGQTAFRMPLKSGRARTSWNRSVRWPFCARDSGHSARTPRLTRDNMRSPESLVSNGPEAFVFWPALVVSGHLSDYFAPETVRREADLSAGCIRSLVLRCSLWAFRTRGVPAADQPK